MDSLGDEEEVSAGIFDISPADVPAVDPDAYDAPAMPPDYDPMPPGKPETVQDGDALTCLVCGKPLEYAGRGRKPKYCDEHKKSKSGGSGASRSPSKGAAGDARIAAEALTQANNLAAVALMVLPEPYRMEATGTAITEASDKFNEQAYQALLQSPELAKAIARAGGISGAAGLVMAYGMLAATITPIAVSEVREKRGTRE